ncbi:hypothetical protein GCM10007981_17190 [Thermocladium modestius]|uniref:Small metal-binding protein n=1 Tax=Thermocladium modestius TaxID=62609 RepID=A0A830GY32_9CREN|nr:DUF1059 domain-containing protein [Thermocladium modestius]GGP22177.1 hypothetical protein GCM10007981_17190 [Thermocladium modestius]
MPYGFKCKDVGMQCGFEVHGVSSEQEMMDIVAAHARHAHGMTTIPPATLDAVKKAIKKE